MSQPTGPSHPVAARGLPGVCTVCRAAPALIAVEANGLDASRSTMCGDCFLRRLREQRARHVTPLGGVPLYIPPTR